MIDLVLGILGSGGFGGIVGGVLGLFNKMEERKLLRVRLSHEKDMAEIDAREANNDRAHEVIMADKQVERAQAEGAIAADLADADAFRESLKAQTAPINNTAEAIRASVRIIVTYLFVGLYCYTFWKVAEQVGGLDALSPEELLDIYKYLIYQTAALVGIVVGWYFGARPSAMPRIPLPK